MKVLVTGCAGYLGSVLCAQLLQQGHRVLGYDLLLYNNRSSIASMEGHDNFTLLEGDIRDLVMSAEAVRSSDIVVHLASIVGAEAVKLSSDLAVLTNVLATRAIAELCFLYHKHLIYTSTASVYGSQTRMAKETSPLSPIELYAHTKVQSERAIKDSMCSSTILRLGTLFGFSSRMRFDLVVNLFVAQASLGEPLRVYGGLQHRPFLHVTDAARAIQFMIKCRAPGIFNVALTNQTIERIAGLVKDIIPGTVIENETEVKDARNYSMSSSLLRSLNFEPLTSIHEGIVEVHDSFKRGNFADYRDPKYSNHGSLSDQQLRSKIFTQGAITG